MRSSLKEYQVLLLLTLASALLAALSFGPVLRQPNNYLMAAGGDGLKTYYNSEWYIRHNPDGATHTGFSYPYGNHLVYTDANPLLSGLLRFVHRHIAPVGKYTVGITNLTLILAFFPCVWMLYLLLRRCLLPQVWAAVFAMAICWLSPQIDRFTGHYALSYLFFIPLLWYLLLRLFEPGRWQIWLALYAGTVALFQFAHPYHFLLGFGWMGAWIVVHVLQQRQEWKYWRWRYAAGLLAAALPVVLLKGWEWATTHTPVDFVKYPWGLLHYTAGFRTIFLPAQPNAYLASPEWDLLHYIGLVKGGGGDALEGAAYVGLVGLALLPLLLWRILALLRRRRRRLLAPVLPAPLRNGIWAATLLLIVANALPFRIFPFLEEVLSFMRQFRSLGRLAWPFFYVYMALAVWMLYAFYRMLRRHSAGLGRIALALAGLALVVWAAEGRILIKRKRDYFLQNSIQPNYAAWRTDYRGLLAEKGFSPDSFQAILALPFYHIGSEKITHEGWHSSFHSMALSLNTGLPMLNGYVARAPLSASLQAIQLMSNPLIPKSLIGLLPNKKPLLLLYTHEPPPPHEQRLIEAATPILQQGDVRLALLSPDAFADTRAAARAAFETQRDSLEMREGLLLRGPGPVIAGGFGDAFFAGDSLGAQARQQLKKGRFSVWDGPVEAPAQDMPMELSVWVRLDAQSNYLPPLFCRQYQGETLLAEHNSDMKYALDIWRGWARISLPFTLNPLCNRLEVFVKGEKLRFDNLLIRPQQTDVYVQEGPRLSLNNYLISP